MNNKPLAWITDSGKGELWWEQSSIEDENGEMVKNPNDIPLYTHPVKELTNEEIEEIAKEFKDVDYTLDEEEAFDVFNHRGFARAILRKAQEK